MIIRWGGRGALTHIGCGCCWTHPLFIDSFRSWSSNWFMGPNSWYFRGIVVECQEILFQCSWGLLQKWNNNNKNIVRWKCIIIARCAILEKRSHDIKIPIELVVQSQWHIKSASNANRKIVMEFQHRPVRATDISVVQWPWIGGWVLLGGGGGVRSESAVDHELLYNGISCSRAVLGGGAKISSCRRRLCCSLPSLRLFSMDQE